MMTEHLQSSVIHQFKDDDIRYQCTFIGNTLHHRSRDLAAEARANLKKTSLRSFLTPTATSKRKTVTPKTPQFRHQSPRQPHQMLTQRSKTRQ